MVRCKICNEEKDEKHFPKKADGGIRRFTCQPCMGKRERSKLKLDMLEALGNQCSCCGEKNPYFLTLDHVLNDGGKFRASRAERILKKKGLEKRWNEQQIYRAARNEGWPKDKYQVLCMNCNFAKGHFAKCPHELGITAEVAMENLRRTVKTVMRSRYDYQASYRGNQHHKVT